ncbi:MAG: hypothetical protein ACREDS_13240 [Limisphaerales bacterium]
MRVFRKQVGQLVCRIVVLALQFLDLLGLLLLECLDLILQFGILMRFNNSGSNGGGERRANNCFLDCGHGNDFGCGNYG